jgi:hypothetical protein
MEKADWASWNELELKAIDAPGRAPASARGYGVAGKGPG